MIASLAMYDPPWLRAANDRLWDHIASRLRTAAIADVPTRLTRGAALDDVWRSPSLILAQSCGYPLMTELRETVQLVATPCYAVEGADGALHRAAIVVRAGDPAAALAALKGRRAGVNSHRSNSGANLLRAAIAPLAAGSAFFGEVFVTGSHARSLAALLAGRIDVAAIDAVTLALLRERYPRYSDRIRIVEWTAATPGLPLVTAATTPAATVAVLREALAAAMADPRLQDSLAALRITGFETLDFDAYAGVLDLEREATARAYASLH